MSVWGLLCNYGAVLVGSWRYWVSMGRYLLVLGDTGSVEGSTRSVQGSKDRKYLGVRSKKFEKGQF